MYLKHLKITNFKNIAQFDQDFNRINCFVGNNGVGKTNILDAIHYLSFCKSYFTNSDFDSIKSGEDFFSVSGLCVGNNNIENYCCTLQRTGKKVFKHSDKAYSRHSEHIGKLPSVIITPGDHNLIDGSSETRRKFVDVSISQHDNTYLKTLICHNKALSQRNKLLKDCKSGATLDMVMMQIVEEQIAAYSAAIQQKRKDFFEDFSVPFSRYYSLIAGEGEQVSLDYKTYSGDILSLLQESRDKDLILGFTTKGTHRDDLVFCLNHNPVKTFGSQGQQKTYLLALKLAQFDYLCSKLKTKPLLMIDDIFDKLDFQRVNMLLKLIADKRFGQIFITDTHQSRIEELIDNELRDCTKIFKL